MFALFKNSETLVADFIKNPKEYENYTKHCLKTLENYLWLKENQYNKEIDSYDYLTKFIYYFGIDFISFSFFFKDYQKDIVDNVPDNKKEIISSNIYYLNPSKEPSAEEKKLHKRFNRLEFIIISLEGSIDHQREYTYKEIYNMVLEKKIIILDNYLSEETIFANILSIPSQKDRVFVSSKCCEILGVNSKTIDNFYACSNDYEKSIWGTINEPFCNYFRLKKIDFSKDITLKGYHLNMDFNDTAYHLKVITEDIIKYYQHKKKKVPPIIQNTILEVQDKLPKLEQAFSKKNKKMNPNNIEVITEIKKKTKSPTL